MTTTPKARTLVTCLIFTMVGFWLETCATFAVIGAQGGPSAPDVALLALHIACWPSALFSIPEDQWLLGVTPTLVNLAGWAVAGLLIGLVFAAAEPYLDKPGQVGMTDLSRPGRSGSLQDEEEGESLDSARRRTRG